MMWDKDFELGRWKARAHMAEAKLRRKAGWLLKFVADDEAHVLPLHDLVEHDTSDGCVCGPDTEYQEGGGQVVIHYSLDGREQRED